MRSRAIIAALSLVTVFVAGGSTANAQSQSNTAATPNNVVVQPGDNLSKIAEKHSTTYVRLYNANPVVENPDVIHPGEQLRIPAADEQLAERPLPADAQVPVAAPAPKPAAKPAPKAAPKPRAAVKKQNFSMPADAGVWDRLAQCESGGNWAINTGNGYYGGLQFSLSSWRAVGGSGLPSQASKAEQISRAEALKTRQGWGAWPACTKKLGLR